MQIIFNDPHNIQFDDVIPRDNHVVLDRECLGVGLQGPGSLGLGLTCPGRCWAK